MAIRVTQADVIAIFQTSISDLTPFITVANIMTDKVYNAGIDAGESVASTPLFEIERWLAAHFAVANDMRSAKEGVGGGSARADISYMYKLGLNLQNTYYGQCAIALDPTGTLNSISNGAVRASFSFVGGDVSDELDT